MNWTDISQAVGSVAPKLGAAIGGPGGQIVGAMVARAVGVDPRPEALRQYLTQDPAAFVRLQELERQMELDRLEDMQHARETRDSVADEAMRRWLALFVVPAPLVLLAGLIWLNPEGALLALGSSVLGYATAEAKQVFAFYFGTSLGSKKKGAELNDLAEWRKNRAS